jgi:hypothetical protein
VSTGSGFASSNSSYVSNSTPATCLPPGHYRIELYVNGQLAGNATANGAWGALHAVRFSDVDGAMCVPDGWHSFSGGAGADGYLSPDAAAGTMILSIPKSTDPALAANQRALAVVMDSVVRSVSGSGGGLLPDLKPAGDAQQTSFFMSSDNGQYQQWTDTSGAVLSGVGTSSNGQVYIGITWGPQDAQLAQQLFLSLSPL